MEQMVNYLSSNTINLISSAKILVIGDLILDEFIMGDVDRISPEAPVPVIDVKSRTLTPGGAANVAANICSAGGDAYLTGIIGDDQAGLSLIKTIQEYGLSNDFIFQEDERRTSKKTRLISQNQQVIRFDEEDRHNVSQDSEQALLTHVNEIVTKYKPDIIIFSDYNKGTLTPNVIKNVISLAKELKIRVMGDIKNNKLSVYQGITCIKPNQKEAIEMAGIPLNQESDVDRIGRIILEKLQAEFVIITRGKEGMSIVQQGLPTINIPAFAKHVYDVTGAGDTVISIFAMAYSQGIPLKEAGYLANIAANIVVGKVGTTVIEHKELISFLNSQSSKAVN